jgi:PKD repeat protein
MIFRRSNYLDLKILATKDLFCKGYAIHTPFSASGTLNVTRWNVTGNNILYSQNSGNTNISIDLMGEGTDTLTVETIDSIGCMFKASKIITVSPLPVANYVYFSENRRVEYNNISDTAIIQDVHRIMPNIYLWSFHKDDSLRLYNKIDTTVKYREGYYDVMLIAINNAGCSDTITKHIFVNSEHALYVPNAFSPDNPAVELSTFRPKGYGLASYEISIYDIWGDLLWYSNKLLGGQPAEGWTGKYNGTTFKLDSYIWKVKATFDDGEDWQGQYSSNGKLSRFGNVLLIR